MLLLYDATGKLRNYQKHMLSDVKEANYPSLIFFLYFGEFIDRMVLLRVK